MANVHVPDSEGFLQKLSVEFSTDEQQLFVDNFVTYVKHHEEPDAFVVNFDDVLVWLGFTRRDNAVRLLKRKFVRESDYITAPLSGGAVFQGGGHNKDCYMLTVDAFKNLCMLAETDKGTQVRKYYIRMENTLFKHIVQTNASLQAELGQSKLLQDQMLSRGLVQGNTNISLCYLAKAVLPIGCKTLTLLKIAENIFKFGESNNITQRSPDLDAYFGVKWVIIAVFKCTNRELLEARFRDSPKYAQYKFRSHINKKKSTEAFKFTPRLLNSFMLDVQKEYTKSIYQGISIEERALAVREHESETQRMVAETERLRLSTLSDLIRAGAALTDAERACTPPRIQSAVDNDHTRNEIDNVHLNESELPPAHMHPEDTNGREVYVYDPSDLSTHKMHFKGITEACRKILAASASQIKSASENGFVYQGYRWQLVDRGKVPGTPKDTINHQKYRKTLVARYENGVVLEVLDSQKAWEERLGVSAGAISTSLRKGGASRTAGVHLAFWEDLDEDVQNVYLETHALPPKRANTKCKEVICINASTNCNVGVPFSSLTKLHRETGVTKKIVDKCVLQPTYQHHGYRYVWK